jgi:hypothetical protein
MKEERERVPPLGGVLTQTVLSGLHQSLQHWVPGDPLGAGQTARKSQAVLKSRCFVSIEQCVEDSFDTVTFGRATGINRRLWAPARAVRCPQRWEGHEELQEKEVRLCVGW